MPGFVVNKMEASYLFSEEASCLDAALGCGASAAPVVEELLFASSAMGFSLYLCLGGTGAKTLMFTADVLDL